MIWREHKVKDIHDSVFYSTRFASPQGALIPLTPHESLIVYRPKSTRRLGQRPQTHAAIVVFRTCADGVEGISTAVPHTVGYFRTGGKDPLARFVASPSEGGYHAATPLRLPAGGLGTPVAVGHAVCCLAQPMRVGTGHASQAHPAVASTLQGAQAVCRPHPQAPLCPGCARDNTSPASRSPAPRSDAAAASPPPQGRYLTALLSPYGLALARLAGAGEPPCQRPSQWRALAPKPPHPVHRPFFPASLYDLSLPTRRCGADCARAGVFG